MSKNSARTSAPGSPGRAPDAPPERPAAAGRLPGGDPAADRTVLVTGGVRGIGLGIAEHFLDAGARVAVTSTSSEGSAPAARLGARYPSERVAHLVVDVRDRAQVASAVDYCVTRFGGLDVVVANAGIDRGAAFLEITEQDWKDVIDVNLTGAFHTVQLAARAMAGRGGRIVVVSSTNSFFVESHIASYNASKAGLLGLVRSAALELAADRITVNAVAPGLIATRMTAALVDHPVHGADYLRQIPSGRFGLPADVAEAVGYLASAGAGWVTGQCVVVDGGQTVGTQLPPETVKVS